MILIYLNAFTGIFVIERKLYAVRRHFDKKYDSLNDMFPGFRRTDCKKWSRWKFYPGAMTILIPRIVLITFLVLLGWAGLCLLLCCHDMKKPLGTCHRVTVRGFYKFILCMVMFLYGGCFTTVYEQNVDYSKWLGGEFSSVDARKSDKASMIVCNHMGWMEILSLMTGPLHPGFTPKKELSKVPVLYGLTRAVQSIYVNRAGTPE